jgi:hypothetical protein
MVGHLPRISGHVPTRPLGRLLFCTLLIGSARE